jgi:hypothetical protein
MMCATKRTLATVVVTLALASCHPPEVDKPAATNSPAKAGETAALPQAAPPDPPASAPIPIPTAPPPQAIAAAPPGTLYVCIKEKEGQSRQTTIEFAPQVAELCRKAPEMGPCQYEREACRHDGGRVFTVDGAEITLQVEADYDRRVMRVRMKSN